MRERIVRAAGGNPLFLTEMVALSGEGGGEVEVPATLRALLAARLDQLDGPERRVLERGAVEGELFHRGAIQALAPEETEVMPRLAALVRRDLVRPDRPMLPREDAYRFRHLLIRDAAYDALPKATRADLHRRFADWLEEHGDRLVELDEILGYHLEQAARYLDELGRARSGESRWQPATDSLPPAGEHTGVATAAAPPRLLERALALTRPHRLDVHLETTLVEVLYWHRCCAGDRSRRRCRRACGARGERGRQRRSPDGRRSSAGTWPAGSARTSSSGVRGRRCRCSKPPETTTASCRRGTCSLGREHARAASRIGRERANRHCGTPVAQERGMHTVCLAIPLWAGPRPASEALATLEALSGEDSYPAELVGRAMLLAMLDRIDEAWALALPAAERGGEFGFMSFDGALANIALIAGDWEAAASFLRPLCERLEESGGTAQLSTYAPRLGNVLCALGRYDEAAELAQLGHELSDLDPDDVLTQEEWRRAQALVHSARGEHVEAEQLAREAVEFGLQTDSPLRQGDGFRTSPRSSKQPGGETKLSQPWSGRSSATSASPSSRSPAASANASRHSNRRNSDRLSRSDPDLTMSRERQR